jgi:hypothetical protein
MTVNLGTGMHDQSMAVDEATPLFNAVPADQEYETRPSNIIQQPTFVVEVGNDYL